MKSKIEELVCQYQYQIDVLKSHMCLMCHKEAGLFGANH